MSVHSGMRLLLRAERAFDRLSSKLRGPRHGAPVIESYDGYATPTEWIGRARILTRLRKTEAASGQGRLRNVLQMLGLFLTDEVAGVTVVGPRGVTAVSDEEGYVTLVLPRGEGTEGQGWVDIPVTAAGAQTVLAIRVPGPEARLAIVSDIDDTVMHTGAVSLVRNLWTSFTGNVSTREVFDDAVAMLTTLSAGGRNPVFFLSSSPWNLHGFLRAVFRRAGVPKGPIFLRDLGLGEGQFIAASHGDHKGGTIDRLMAANPDLNFVLMGDTGQHDAEVYAAAAERHPGRVAFVALRNAGKIATPEAVETLKRLEVPHFIGSAFDTRAVTDALGPGLAA